MVQRFTAQQVCHQILASLDGGSDDETVGRQNIDFDVDENDRF